MRVATLVFALALASGCKGKPKAPPKLADDPVINVDNDDAEMNQAIAAARAHLPQFEAELARAEPGKKFSVKKPFAKPSGGHEHMWLIDVKAVEGGFEGALDNTSQGVPEAKLGQRYVVSRTELSDWMITDAEPRLWGAYTLRVLLPQMDPTERAAMEQILQPLPP